MQEKVYPSGMRLVFEKDTSIKAVAVKIYCLVGGIHEDDSNRGIAHLAEHMFFKGTNKRKAKDISGVFDRLGIMINAFTDLDRTCYHCVGLTEHMETMFDVMSDCLYNSTYPEDELAKEKTVVCSELEMYNNDFEHEAETNGLIIGLQGSGYDYPLGGTVESVSALFTQDLIDFRDKWYTPNRIVVSVCGDVSYSEVEAMVEKYLVTGKEPVAQPVSFKAPLIDIDIQSRCIFESKDTDQVYAMINYRGINKSSSEMPAFNLARLALGSTQTSRLFVKLREEHGLVYVVTTYPNIYGDFGVNSIYFIASAKNAPKVFSLVRETLDEVREKGFSEEELATYKNISKSSLVLGNQSIAGKAGKNAESLIYTETEFDVDKKIAEIEAVTLEEMNAAFKKYFAPEYLTISLVAKENNIDCLSIMQD